MPDTDPISDTPSGKKGPPPRKLKNIGVRLITGLLIGVFAFVPLLFGGPIWLGLVGLFALRAIWEWVRMSETDSTSLAYIIPMVGAMAVLLCAYLTVLSHNPVLYKAAFFIALTIAAIAGFERMRRNGAIWASLGFLYIIIPAALLVILRGNESGASAQGFKNLIYIILIVVAADVGAYIGGSFIGGPKMAPKLSPNKTWAGFFSGLLAACIIGAFVAGYFNAPIISGAIFAIPIMVFSVLGDILESGFKRKLEIKDTGGLLPGHGGVLDRVDSLMMAVVFAALILILIPEFWPLT